MKIRLLWVAVIIGTMLSACSPGASDPSSTSDTPSPLEPDSSASLMTQIGKISCNYEGLSADVQGLEGDFWDIFSNAAYHYVLTPGEGLQPKEGLKLEPEVLEIGLLEALQDPANILDNIDEDDLTPQQKCEMTLLYGRMGFLYTWLYAEAYYFGTQIMMSTGTERDGDNLKNAHLFLSIANNNNLDWHLDWSGNGLDHPRLFAFPAVVQGFTAGTAPVGPGPSDRPALGKAAYEHTGWFNFAGGVFFESLHDPYTGIYNDHEKTNSEVAIWKIMMAGAQLVPDSYEDFTDTYLNNDKKWNKCHQTPKPKDCNLAKAAKTFLGNPPSPLPIWWDGWKIDNVPVKTDPFPPASLVQNVLQNTTYAGNQTGIVPGNVEDNYLVLGDVTFMLHHEDDNDLWLDRFLAAYNHITTLPEYDTWISATKLHNRITLANEIMEGNEGAMTDLKNLINVESQQYPTCMTCHRRRCTQPLPTQAPPNFLSLCPEF